MEHITGVQLDEERLAAALQELRDNVDVALIRKKNLELTRQAVRDSVTPDILIINAINTIDELDRVANTLAKRLREWYAHYDPETEKANPDHELFAQAILAAEPRTENTMGAPLHDRDVAAMREEAAVLGSLYSQRAAHLAYLEERMTELTPNIKKVAGAIIGAKLLALAGSLARLSRLPSSTVQLLGAETALFRHLRNRNARPPKHGVIFNHTTLQRAPKDMRGKVARVLADKISIASKIDYFKGEYMGDELVRQIEEKLAPKPTNPKP